MTGYCLMFAGQSIQQSGMGSELLRDDRVWEYLGSLSDVFEQDVPWLLAEAGEEHLGQTGYAQIAIHAHHLGCLYLLRRDHPEVNLNGAIGHSLGIVAALVAAGAMTDVDSARFVKARAAAFQRACDGPAAGSGLVAISSEELDDQTETIVGDCAWALRNSITKAVLGGSAAALDRWEATADRLPVKWQRLNVQGAFHTEQFASIKDELRESLQNLAISQPAFPVFMGTSGQGESDPARIASLLVDQADHVEDHLAAVEASYEAGCRQYLEIGFRTEPIHWLQDQLIGEDWELLPDVRAMATPLSEWSAFKPD